MALYNVTVSNVRYNGRPATLFRVGFGDQAQNSAIVAEVEGTLAEMEAKGLQGEVALVNGPASLPVAMVLAHHLLHRFGAVGCFDPKHPLPDGRQGGAYVVASCHGGPYRVGDLIPGADVEA